MNDIPEKEIKEKRKRVSRACKHKYIHPVYENDSGKKGTPFVLKCSWCYQVFQTAGELEEEYKRLHVAYKIVDIDRYRENDPFTEEWDPATKKKERIESGDLYMRGRNSQSRGNKLQWNSHRWGHNI